MANSSSVLEVVLSFRDRLTAGLRTTGNQIRGFADRARQSFQSISSKVFTLKNAFLGLAAGLLGKGIFDTIKGVADLGDTLLATSRKTGISVESLSELKFAAEQSNVSFEQLVQGILKLQRNMAEFALTGQGEAAPALKLLGKEITLAVKEGLPLEDLLGKLSTAFNGLQTQEEKVLVATKLFGRSGAELLPLLVEGKDGIEALTVRARELGLVWSETDARAADDFGDALARLTNSIRATAEAVVKPLLPAFTKLFDKLTSFVVDNQPEIIRFFKQFVALGFETANKIRAIASDIAESLGVMLRPILNLQENLAQDRFEAARVFFGTLTRDLKAITLANGQIASGMEDFAANLRREIPRASEEVQRLAEEYKKLLRVRQLIDEGTAPGRQSGLLGATLGAFDEAEVAARTRNLDRQRRLLEQTTAEHRSAFQGPPSLDDPRPRIESEDLETLDQLFAPPPKARPPRGRELETQLNETKTGIEGVVEALDLMKERGEASFANLREGTLAVGDSLADNLTEGIIEVGTEFDRVGEVFKNVGKSILTELQRIILKLTLMRLISAGLGALGFGKAAAGPLDDFVLHHPTLAARGTPATTGVTIAGEAGPEAIIPLPGNREVPVHLMGSTGHTYVTNNITAMDAPSFDAYVRQSAGRQKHFFGQLHAHQWETNPTLRARYRR